LTLLYLVTELVESRRFIVRGEPNKIPKSTVPNFTGLVRGGDEYKMRTSEKEKVPLHKVNDYGHPVVVAPTNFLALTPINTGQEELHGTV
jgi:hypothetical protein